MPLDEVVHNRFFSRRANEMTKSKNAPTKHILRTKAAVPASTTKPRTAAMKATAIRITE
jgi:hypothetical protein